MKNQPDKDTVVQPAPENAAPVAEKTESVVWKITKFVLKLGVSAAILCYLIFSRDIKWSDFGNVKPIYIFFAFLCVLAQVFLTSVRWRSLLKTAGIRCSVYEAFSLQMQGLFFSQFLPGGSVGGDVVKAGIMASRTPSGGKFNCVFSIFMDRLCGLNALLLTLLLTCLMCRDTIALFDEPDRNALMIMCAVCACLFAATVMLFFCDLLYKAAFFRFFLNIADKLTKNTFRQAADAVSLYRTHWQQIVFWIGCTTFVFFPILGLPVWLLANGIYGAPSRPLLPCLMTSNISQAIAAIPISFGGTGTRDVACTRMLEAMNFNAPDNVLVPLLVTAITIGVGLLGAFFFVGDRKKNAPSQAQKKN